MPLLCVENSSVVGLQMTCLEGCSPFAGSLPPTARMSEFLEDEIGQLHREHAHTFKCCDRECELP